MTPNTESQPGGSALFDQDPWPVAREVIEHRQLGMQRTREQQRSDADQKKWRDQRVPSHEFLTAACSASFSRPKMISSAGHVRPTLKPPA